MIYQVIDTVRNKTMFESYSRYEAAKMAQNMSLLRPNLVGIEIWNTIEHRWVSIKYWENIE
jgi:hypothetical protein